MTETITLPADVRRLVIAARAFIDPDTVARCCRDEQRELFEASEAFASRVPWENGPDEEESPTDAPTPSPSWKAMWDALRDEIINTPETADFMAAVPLEAAHQRQRWPSDHDAGKSPFDWFWLLGYLVQKAADAAVRGDVEKARHHTISSAAALANWHAALSSASTAMRPGIDPGGAA